MRQEFVSHHKLEVAFSGRIRPATGDLVTLYTRTQSSLRALRATERHSLAHR